MKNSNVIIAALIILIVIFFIAAKYEAWNKREISVEGDFPNSLVVETNVDLPYVNLVAKTIAHKVLKYDTLEVIIVKMKNEVEFSNIEAYVVEIPRMDNAYMISLSSTVNNRTDLIRVLSHEFAHIKQFEEGRMRTVNLRLGLYEWEGTVIDLREIDYKNRPMEIDAYKEGKLISFDVIPHLYQ
jgi:hypothetical protein